jgi:hypothetical protein
VKKGRGFENKKYENSSTLRGWESNNFEENNYKLKE